MSELERERKSERKIDRLKVPPFSLCVVNVEFFNKNALCVS